MIDTYDKLTIGKYLEIKAIIEDNCDEVDKNVRMVAVLGDFDEEDVLDFTLPVFRRYMQSLGFLTEKPKTRPVLTSYKLGDMVLETVLNVESMTTSQFIDYQTFIKEDNKICELLSCFLIPKGKKYNKEYDIIEVQKLIRDNLSIIDALSLSAFFLQWYQALSQTIITSLIKKMKKMKKKEKNKEIILKIEEVIANLERSGDGLQWLTEYRRQFENLGE